MSILTPDQMNIGSDTGATIAPGKSANIVITSFTPFQYGTNKDKTMPKYLAKDADTGMDYEFVGFQFHDCVKELNDSLELDVTVINVVCLDNGTKYPDYELTVVTGKKPAVATPVKEEEIKTEDIPFK